MIEYKETDKYEVNAIKNEFKAKIKYWRKELGGETENKIKVETKLEVLSKTKNELQSKIEIEDIPILVTVTDDEESICTICAEPMENYLSICPRFFRKCQRIFNETRLAVVEPDHVPTHTVLRSYVCITKNLLKDISLFFAPLTEQPYR